MTTTPQYPDGSRLVPRVMAALLVVLVLADLGLAAIAALFFAIRSDSGSDDDSAAFAILGVSALVGAVIYLVTAVASARRPGRGRELATAGRSLALLRLLLLVVAIVIAAVVAGLDAMTSGISVFLMVLALFEAMIGLWVTRVVTRRIKLG
jgi:hypothetical protein